MQLAPSFLHGVHSIAMDYFTVRHKTVLSIVPVEYSSVHLKSILNLTKIFHSLVKYICCMFDMSPRRARERGRVEGVLCCGYGARLSDECGDTGERGANVDSDQGDCLQS